MEETTTQAKQPGRYAESTRTGAWYIIWHPVQYMHGKIVAQCTNAMLEPKFNPNGTPVNALLTPDRIKLKAFLD